MSNNYRPAKPAEIRAAEKEQIQASDLDGNATLSDSEFVDVWEVEASRTQVYTPGFGVGNRDQAEGFADLDLDDSGLNSPDGEARFVTYRSDSKESIMRKSKTIALSALRQSDAESLRDKEIIPQRGPFANDGRVVALQVRLASGSAADGNTVSTADSSTTVGIPYARLER